MKLVPIMSSNLKFQIFYIFSNAVLNQLII